MPEQNAFAPKVDVLIKLAQIVNHVLIKDQGGAESLLRDSQVLGWYDRMAELSYVPARPGGRHGYQLFATTHEHLAVASYTEAESVELALKRCFEQFPIADGHYCHGVKDIATQVVSLPQGHTFYPGNADGSCTYCNRLTPGDNCYPPVNEPEEDELEALPL